LYRAGQGNRVVEAMCKNKYGCHNVAAADETRSDDLEELSFDHLVLGAGSGSFITLARTESQFSPACKVKTLSWNPSQVQMPYNDLFFTSILDVVNVTFDDFSTGDVATMYLEYVHPKISEVLYTVR